jgi:hypothetical protein
LLIRAAMEHAHSLVFVGGDVDLVDASLRRYAAGAPHDIALLDLRGAAFLDQVRVNYAGRLTNHPMGVYPLARATAARIAVISNPCGDVELVRVAACQQRIDERADGIRRLLVTAVGGNHALRHLDFLAGDDAWICRLDGISIPTPA